VGEENCTGTGGLPAVVVADSQTRETAVELLGLDVEFMKDPSRLVDPWPLSIGNRAGLVGIGRAKLFRLPLKDDESLRRKKSELAERAEGPKGMGGTAPI